MNRHRFTIGGIGHALFGNHGIGTTGTGETGGLGEAAELNSHLTCPLDLIDRAWQAIVLNKRLVGGIVEDQRLVGFGIIDPRLELLFGRHHAGWIIGEAEIDQVNRLSGWCGHEAIFTIAIKIDQPLITTITRLTGTTRHHVGIDIDWIDRIGHRNGNVGGKDLLEVTRVTLGAITHKDLIGLYITAAILKIILGDRLAQKIVALLRAVTVE